MLLMQFVCFIKLLDAQYMLTYITQITQIATQVIVCLHSTLYISIQAQHLKRIARGTSGLKKEPLISCTLNHSIFFRTNQMIDVGKFINF